MSTTLRQRFGHVVRVTREDRGWSQEQLAGRADLNRSYVGEVERGRAIASLTTVEKLAGALGVSPSTLVIRGEAVKQQNLARFIKLTSIAC